MTKPIRILIAKPGLDGHDRGAKVIAQAFRNAGMEVIYTGLRQTPEQIVQAAIQEDVDIIALSCLSGAHNHLFPKVMELLKTEGVNDIIVLGGGVIPKDDIPFLKKAGIAGIFTSGTSIKTMLDFIEKNVGSKVANMITRIDHIGVAVNSIDAVRDLYENVLGIRITETETVADQKVKVAFLPVGDSEIELLESTDSEGPIAKFIAARGEGIQHIALRVTDIDAKLAELKAKGIRLIDETPRRGAGGARIAFLHPKATNGTLIELCERE